MEVTKTKETEEVVIDQARIDLLQTEYDALNKEHEEVKDENKQKVYGCAVDTKTKALILDFVENEVEWEYMDDIPNERLRGTTGGVFMPQPDEWGNGSWVAETMEDAKQMEYPDEQ